MGGAQLPALPLIVCLDVDYRDLRAAGAGVWFRGWVAGSPEHEQVEHFEDIAPYETGAFFRRELPCLLGILEKGPRADIIVVDGYVWLGEGDPGLGAHLYHALKEETPVIGIAKTRFHAATSALPVLRGESQQPLHVTSAGLPPEDAALWLTEMHGAHRIPTMLRRVDRLARDAW